MAECWVASLTLLADPPPKQNVTNTNVECWRTSRTLSLVALKRFVSSLLVNFRGSIYAEKIHWLDFFFVIIRSLTRPSRCDTVAYNQISFTSFIFMLIFWLFSNLERVSVDCHQSDTSSYKTPTMSLWWKQGKEGVFSTQNLELCFKNGDRLLWDQSAKTVYLVILFKKNVCWMTACDTWKILIPVLFLPDSLVQSWRNSWSASSLAGGPSVPAGRRLCCWSALWLVWPWHVVSPCLKSLPTLSCCGPLQTAEHA